MRRPALALGSTLLVQATATLALTAPSVLAPVTAPLIGQAPERVGLFVGLAYLAAMFSGLTIGAQVAALGAVRVSAWALAACAAGLVLGASGHWAALGVAAILIGAGYGVPNPASAKILGIHSPVDRRGLFFSIKQAGVPIGVGVAGLLVPALLGVTSWQGSVLVLAAICTLAALATRATRALDAADGHEPAARDRWAHPFAPAVATMFAPLRRVVRDPALRRIGLVSLVYSMTQLVFVTFVVSYLKLERGHSLASAAGILAVAQLTSVAARVFWGYVADHWVAPRTLLGVLGVAAGLSLVGLAAVPSAGAAPAWVAAAAAMACAGTAMAWNGVFYAELAQRARPEEMAPITGATQFMTFFGAMTGPVVFGSAVGALDGYASTYRWFSLAPIAVGAWTLAVGARRVSPA